MSSPAELSSPKGTIQYSVPEAARLLGITPRAVRKRIEAGTLCGTRVGRDWVVVLPGERIAERQEPREELGEPRELTSTAREPNASPVELPSSPAEPGEPTAPKWLVEQLYRDNVQLAGQLGFYQARIQELERRILELEAPKEAPAEMSNMSNNPAHAQNVADSGSEKLSSRPWWRFWR